MGITTFGKMVIIVLLALLAVRPAVGQSILQNDLVRIGSGSEDSVVNSTGTLNQPFLKSNGTWVRLTYSNNDLDYALKAGGVSLDFTGSNPTIDTSGFTSFSTSGGFNIGYGTITAENAFS